MNDKNRLLVVWRPAAKVHPTATISKIFVDFVFVKMLAIDASFSSRSRKFLPPDIVAG